MIGIPIIRSLRVNNTAKIKKTLFKGPKRHFFPNKLSYPILITKIDFQAKFHHIWSIWVQKIDILEIFPVLVNL